MTFCFENVDLKAVFEERLFMYLKLHVYILTTLMYDFFLFGEQQVRYIYAPLGHVENFQ